MDIKLNPHINIIYGNNAQGKTNLLESIYILGFTKSHLLSMDNNLIKVNKNFCEVKGVVKKRSFRIKYEVDYINENKITEIYLCGIDTECCVLKTAFDLFELEYNVYVLKDYCACTHGIEKHNNALEILRRNIGKDYVI